MGRTFSSLEIIRRLEKSGWYECRCNGDHHHFIHPEHPGTVTVPHPRKDISQRLLNSIEKQSGIRF